MHLFVDFEAFSSSKCEICSSVTSANILLVYVCLISVSLALEGRLKSLHFQAHNRFIIIKFRL
jgi:hypothetical protein